MSYRISCSYTWPHKTYAQFRHVVCLQTLLCIPVFKCNPPHSGHNPIMSSIFSEIDIPFVVCVIYWSLPTSGSPQEIAWNGPKLVYDCVVWAGAVMVLILCPPHLGIYIKLICIVFMECLLKLVNSAAAPGWLCRSKHPAGSAVVHIASSLWCTLQPNRKPITHDELTACRLRGFRGRTRAARVNVDQLHSEHVRGMATDRLLMRPLSALVLSSPPGAPVDALHLISIEFHSTELVYSKYACFN